MRRRSFGEGAFFYIILCNFAFHIPFHVGVNPLSDVMTIHMRLFLTIFTALLLMFPAKASSQDDTGDCLPDTSAWFRDLRRYVARPKAPDSLDVARLEKKAFWRASAETLGLNIGLWAFDRYVQKGHYAYISWETIKENFRHGFEWDNDHLGTNMFAHPYNGSLFYNAGRSNGYNFWQSELFAIAGSAMWEMFMECEYPSTNDIIATPIGGAAIGEALYRTADVILDGRSRGEERFGRELAAFIVSPMRGFTRLVTGRAWEHRATTGRRFGTPPVTVAFSLGPRLLVFHNGDDMAKAGLSARIYLEYGDRFSPETRHPYDYFSFLLDLDVMKTQPLLNRVEIMGRLLSRSLIDTHKTDLSIGMYQHFDYFDSDTISKEQPALPLMPCQVPYKFGTPASIGGGLTLQHTECNRWRLDAYAHVNAVILGGILSDFYRFYHRNYNWGSGFSLKGGFNFNMPRKRFNAGADARFFRLYTWDGYRDQGNFTGPDGRPLNIQGDRSNGSFFNLNIHANYRIFTRLYATLSFDWYRRYSHYPDISLRFTDQYGNMSGTDGPIITSDQLGLKLMLTYHL